jgi:hypothetical protein
MTPTTKSGRRVLTPTASDRKRGGFAEFPRNILPQYAGQEASDRLKTFTPAAEQTISRTTPRIATTEV